MKHLYALVMMQLKDKLDLSFVKTRRTLIAKIVLTLLKFLIVGAIAFGLFKVLSLLIFTNMKTPSYVLIFVYGVIFLMSLFSCTAGLMKTLYFADDNKVLITLPVNANVLFLSRLIVYFIYEVKRNLFLTVPIFIAFGIHAGLAWYFYIWVFPVFFFVSAIPVLAGALLSIPSMYVYTFVKKRPALLAVWYVVLIVSVVFVTVKLIGLIPEEINLIEQAGTIQRYMTEFFMFCRDYFYPANIIVIMACGRQVGLFYVFTKDVPIYFGIIVGTVAVLGSGAFFASRPLFFSMMSKTVEFEKVPPRNSRKNITRSRMGTFLNAEISALLRSRQIGTFVTMYIIVPVLVYLLNKVFKAMDTNLTGVYMVYAFNLLVIVLPMLAVDSVVATLYSREGRAAYVKKTMPVNPVVPLLTKLIPLLVASAISLIVSVTVFAGFVELNAWQVALLCISVIGLQWGHILWSGMTDLMKPMNEQYATVGEVNDNPNESFMTISAFIVSFVYALYAFILFPENVGTACVKLCLMGVAFCAIIAYMYFLKIKVYYFEK